MYVACVVVLLGCDGNRREASALVGAVDRYRAADNDHKTAYYEALVSVPCSDAQVCSAKIACVKVAEPTAKALRLQREVATDLGRIASGALGKEAPEARALPAKLAESDALLAAGEAALGDCAEKATALRVRYGF